MLIAPLIKPYLIKFSHNPEANIWFYFALFQLSCYLALIIHIVSEQKFFK